VFHQDPTQGYKSDQLSPLVVAADKVLSPSFFYPKEFGTIDRDTFQFVFGSFS